MPESRPLPPQPSLLIPVTAYDVSCLEQGQSRGKEEGSSRQDAEQRATR